MSKGLTAVLWDLDGVIADTWEYHYLAWRDVFAARGATFTKEDFMRFFGRRHDTIIRFALGDGLSPEEFQAVTEAKQTNYRKRVADNVRALPGAIKLIHTLNREGIPTAIASSAPWDNIEIIIRGLGVADCFQAVATGTEVAEGKPSPEIFRLAARKLKADPAGCVVIEDAVAGVAGARRAGMKCVAVTNSHPAASLQDADLVVDTLEKVTIASLTGLFNAAG